MAAPNAAPPPAGSGTVHVIAHAIAMQQTAAAAARAAFFLVSVIALSLYTTTRAPGCSQMPDAPVLFLLPRLYAPIRRHMGEIRPFFAADLDFSASSLL